MIKYVSYIHFYLISCTITSSEAILSIFPKILFAAQWNDVNVFRDLGNIWKVWPDINAYQDVSYFKLRILTHPRTGVTCSVSARMSELSSEQSRHMPANKWVLSPNLNDPATEDSWYLIAASSVLVEPEAMICLSLLLPLPFLLFVLSPFIPPSGAHILNPARALWTATVGSGGARPPNTSWCILRWKSRLWWHKVNNYLCHKA